MLNDYKGSSVGRRRAWPISLTIIAATVLWAGLDARAETATGYMRRVADELLDASRSASATQFAATIRKHADVPSIGLAALGSYRTRLPKSERPRYYSGMINFIARYAAKEAPKYPVAKAIVISASRTTSGKIYVESTVTLRSGQSYDVRWRLVRRGKSFKVRDAEVIGFEMTSFLNTLFQNYISDNGGNPRVLVMALNR